MPEGNISAYLYVIWSMLHCSLRINFLNPVGSRLLGSSNLHMHRSFESKDYPHEVALAANYISRAIDHRVWIN
jgi:hypothetical protein